MPPVTPDSYIHAQAGQLQLSAAAVGSAAHWQPQGSSKEHAAALAPWEPEAASPLANMAPGRSESGGADGWRRWPRVSDDDLAYFQDILLPVQDQLLTGSIGNGWSLIMDKEIAGRARYLSYQRATPTGSTDYLSITLAANASAQEFDEFTLDDEARPHWEGFLKDSTLLASGEDPDPAEQLVGWRRSFPFGFLGDRAYTIARRSWPGPGPHQVTTVSKGVTDPVVDAWVRANYPGVVRCDHFFSAWRCRTIPDPWGADTPAVETVLLHRDEMKVPEYLARTAIRYGMWRFVREMITVAADWIVERRSRVSPYESDPEAFSRRAADPRELQPHHAPAAAGLVSPDVTRAASFTHRVLRSVPTAPAELSALAGGSLESGSSSRSNSSGGLSLTSSSSSSVLSLSEYYGTAGMASWKVGADQGHGMVTARSNSGGRRPSARVVTAIQKHLEEAAGKGLHHCRSPQQQLLPASSHHARSHSLTWEPTADTFSSMLTAHAIAFTPRASRPRQLPPASPFAATAGAAMLGSNDTAQLQFDQQYPTVFSGSRPAAASGDGEVFSNLSAAAAQVGVSSRQHAVGSSQGTAGRSKDTRGRAGSGGFTSFLLAPVGGLTAGAKWSVSELARAWSAAVAAAGRARGHGSGGHQQDQDTAAKGKGAIAAVQQATSQASGHYDSASSSRAHSFTLDGPAPAAAAAGITPQQPHWQQQQPGPNSRGSMAGSATAGLTPAKGVTWAPAGPLSGDRNAPGSSVASSRRSSMEGGEHGAGFPPHLPPVHGTAHQQQQCTAAGKQQRQTLGQLKQQQQQQGAGDGGAFAGKLLRKLGGVLLLLGGVWALRHAMPEEAPQGQQKGSDGGRGAAMRRGRSRWGRGQQGPVRRQQPEGSGGGASGVYSGSESARYWLAAVRDKLL